MAPEDGRMGAPQCSTRRATLPRACAVGRNGLVSRFRGAMVGTRLSSNRYPSVVALRHQAVVSLAEQAKMRWPVIPAEAERIDMMNLQRVALGASPALLVSVVALPAVPLAHRPSHGSRDVAETGRCIGVTERLAGFLRLGEAAGLEPCELLRDRLLDDRGEITVGDLGPQERAQPLQLLVELRTRRELHLVFGGSEGFDEEAGRRSCDLGPLDSVRAKRRDKPAWCSEGGIRTSKG